MMTRLGGLAPWRRPEHAGRVSERLEDLASRLAALVEEIRRLSAQLAASEEERR
jgi:uncharacterized small protein (DUF1192 family)